MATARISTPKLDRLRSFLREIGGQYRVVIRWAEPDSASKRMWLARAGRDFFPATAHLRRQVLSVLKQEIGKTLRMNTPTYDQARIAAAAAIKLVYVNRITQQGPDVRLRPLSDNPRGHGYLSYKRRHPLLDTRIGIATGMWLRDLRARATVYLRKTRPA